MRQAEFITSPANPLLKEVRKALTRGGLTGTGWCVAETFHLLEEALRSDCRVQAILTAETVRPAVESLMGAHDIRLVVVPDKLLDAATQGVVALVEPPVWSAQQTLAGNPLVLVIDGVQDPGNLGTIVRSAEAFGASGMLMVKGTVNAFNSKVIRASAGSIFRLPFVQGMDGIQLAATLRESGVQIYAAVPKSTCSLVHADLARPCAIIIGSEGQGVTPLMRSAGKELSIPTTGVESLNAAVSAAVLLYEARRQRSLPHAGNAV